jgi:glucosyl-dolichyl phosphate glucuronosyltransferase
MRWSVIICTHNRAGDLKANLPRLHELNYPLKEYEVLVIDNGSADETADVIKAAAQFNNTIVYLREDRLGLSHARNRGIVAAKGDLIAFIDDDAWPEGNWLAELEKGFADPRVGCVGGRVVPFFSLQNGWPTWLPERLRGFFTVVDYPEKRDLHYPGYPAGTNISFRKKVLSEIGPFSSSLGRNGESLLSMEEVELCLRIERAGHKILYLPDAVVHHAVNEARLTRGWVEERCYWQGISAAFLEKEQFSKSKILFKSGKYLLFILVGSLAQRLYAWIGNDRGAFFCRCQTLLCKTYLKKVWDAK